jgi:hypothetical protein
VVKLSKVLDQIGEDFSEACKDRKQAVADALADKMIKDFVTVAEAAAPKAETIIARLPKA